MLFINKCGNRSKTQILSLIIMLQRSLLILCCGLLSPLVLLNNVRAETASSTAIKSKLQLSSETVIAQVGAEVKSSNDSTKVGNVNFSYKITDRWYGGYRVEIDFASIADAKNWMASINLPEGHTVIENYGILISQNNSGSINIAGDEWNSSLSTGEKSEAILIVAGDAGENQEIISFDKPVNAVTNVPTVSSFTKEDRQQFRDDRVAQNSPDSQMNANTGIDSSSSNESQPTTNSGSVTESQVNADSQMNTNTSINSSSSNESQPTTNSGSVTESQVNADSEIAASNSENYSFNGQVTTNQQGTFSYGEVLQKSFLMFEANRSGKLPADNRIPWRSDSTLNDGADYGKDLTKGYFDAGDHIIFGQPMAFSITMLAWGGVDYKDAYKQSGQLDELLEAVKWGTDWILKAHEMNGGKTKRLFVQVGDAEDHQYWVPPEEIANVSNRPSFYVDPSHPGSDISAGMASALAASSMLFKGTDDAYAATLISNAKALFDFAETYPGKYSDSVPAVNPFYTSWSGYWDELCLASIWLYRATGDTVYLQKAEAYFDKQIGQLGDWSYAPDDHSYAAAALLAKESKDPKYKSQVQTWLNNWVNGSGAVKYTPGGFAHRNNWASAAVTLGTSFIAEWYSDNVESNQQYSDFATNQLDYLLGKNPRNFSYVIGFGKNYPLRPHHRGSAGSVPLDNSDTKNTNILWGALVGGLSSPDDYAYNDRRDDWITNEVGTSYNAPLTSTAIQQYENYGGDPLSDEKLNQIINDPQ